MSEHEHDAATPASAPAPAAGGSASTARDGASTEGLLRVDHVKMYFPIKSGVVFDREVARVHAVDDVSFTLKKGETLGLVGESGCGKSTLARCILRLLNPTDGSITFDETDVTRLSRRQLRPQRREMQMIFQDPYASLNPRKRVGQIVGDPMKLHKQAKGGDSVKKRVQDLLSTVGLNPEHYNRFPHEFSGGQRQRIGIARALALQPKLIVADEPVSALDVSIQAQIVNLLDDLQNEFELTYIFVAHDLGVVRHVSDRVAVMYLGKIVEVSPADDLYAKPLHPYTVALLSAIPIPDPRANAARNRIVLQGDVPSPIDPPSGCRFRTRCPRATEICATVEPPLADFGNGHLAACHHPVNTTAEEVRQVTRSDESPLSSGQELPIPDESGPDFVGDGPQRREIDPLGAGATGAGQSSSA
jgi:oligopeptide/dipeptide ABC transporter ATP-binding protein